MRIINAIALLLAIGATVAAHAGPVAAASAPTDDSASQLASLQAQIPIWQARARIAKLKAEIHHAEKGAPAGGEGPFAGHQPSGAAATASPAIAPPPMQAAQGSMMHLETVSAYNGHYVALLDIDGAGIQVRQGDEVAGGWRVARITDSAVELVRGKQSRLLRL